MKLTSEEQRTVELVEHGVGKGIRGFLWIAVVVVIAHVLIWKDWDGDRRPVWMMNQSDLREIIRQEIHK